MTRQAFLARLREGLRGLPTQTVADMMADYEAHIADGAAAGRSEEEVAAALGNPDRLAREIRAESSLNRWCDERSPTESRSLSLFKTNPASTSPMGLSFDSRS